MMVLLVAYKWTLLGGVIGGAALALVGSQLASRSQSVQTLVISQAAALGTVLGLAINIFLGTHAHGFSFVPLLFGFLFASFFYGLCEIIISHRWPSRNTYYVGIFGLLLSVTHAIVSLVPGLEMHMAASYFGDLSVASDLDSLAMAAIGVIGLTFFGRCWRQVTALSFDVVTFGIGPQGPTDRKVQRMFVVLSLVTLSASIQLMWFLFTLSCLFLPTMVMARTNLGLRGLQGRLVFGTAVGVTLGFIFSLWHGKIPTVPCIGAALLLSSMLVGIGCRWCVSRKCRTNKPLLERRVVSSQRT
jgi:zinc/manganese transport system permease protein